MYEILRFVQHEGRALDDEDASRIFPVSLDWSHVRRFVDAAIESNLRDFDEWYVFPDHDDLSVATIWSSRDDGSGALWTGVAIECLVSDRDIQEQSYTWGDAI
ncbi:hypothetical protein RB200_02995 [Streptomyces sp. PmtG]